MKRARTTFLLIAFASTVFAAEEAPVRSLRVEIPRSTLRTSELASTQAEAPGARLEASIGSWAPRGFQGYVSGSIPYLALTRSALMSSSPQANGEWNLHSQLGLGIRGLEREETVEMGITPVRASQSLYLIPFRAGFQLRRSFGPKGIEPFAGIALAPTAAITPRSSLRPGSTSFGLALEGMLGARTDLGGLLSTRDVGLFGSLTVGQIGGVSALGWGMQVSYSFLKL